MRHLCLTTCAAILGWLNADPMIARTGGNTDVVGATVANLQISQAQVRLYQLSACEWGLTFSVDRQIISHPLVDTLVLPSG